MYVEHRELLLFQNPDKGQSGCIGVGPFLIPHKQPKFLPYLQHWAQASLTPQTTSAYFCRYQLCSAKPTCGPLSLTPPVRCRLTRVQATCSGT
eukprot:6786049-Ditylum_brightwellii.AAC.1